MRNTPENMSNTKTDIIDSQKLSSGQLETVVRGKSTPEKTDSRKKTTIDLHVAPHKMLARRYELKYRIPEPMAQRIKGFVSAFLSPDPYTRRWSNGQYPICSLYFDSNKFDLYRETELDKCNRFKLRIRGYDDEPDSPVFFEIKRKLNGIIFKSRAKAGKDQIAEILKGHFLPPDATEADRTILKQFVHYIHCLCARPVVLVRYQREAYEGETDTRVRVTFDRQLNYLSTDKPFFKMNRLGWKKVPIDFTVLEIKFTDYFPAWLVDMTRMFDLNR
jgi:hypothetical protein